MTLCLLHREGGLVDRALAQQMNPALDPTAVCKVLVPTP